MLLRTVISAVTTLASPLCVESLSGQTPDGTLAGIARRGRAEQRRVIGRLPDRTAYGNDGDASAVTARIDERPVVEDASVVAPEPPAREAGGEDAQAVLAGARRHGLLHVRQRGPGDQVTGQQSREKAGQVLGVGDDPSRRPREIRIGARVIEVP